MTATARIIALVREHLRAPDDLAARVTLQAIALEVAELEVRARILAGLAGADPVGVDIAIKSRAFETAMDALSLERSGLEAVK
jgi:hypothetical protein